MRFAATLLTICALGGSRLSAQDPIDRSHDSKVWTNSNSGKEPVVIPLDWSLKTRTGKVPERVTPSRVVSWRIDHFNFMRFEPVVTVDAAVVPGYAILESLWSQVIGLAPAVAKAGVGAPSDDAKLFSEQSPFLLALQNWRAAVVSAQVALGKQVEGLPASVDLNDKQLDSIVKAAAALKLEADGLEADRKDAEGLILHQYASAVTNQAAAFSAATKTRDSLVAAAKAAKSELDQAAEANKKAMTAAGKKAAKDVLDAKQTAFDAISASLKNADASVATFGADATLTTSPIAEAYYAQMLYDAELTTHNALMTKLAEFARRAAECAKGRTATLDPRKAGTIVTVTGKATAVSQAAPDVAVASKADPITVRYYVQSEMPLVFHAGIAWTSIEDFDYQVVQKNVSGDVFQQIQKPDQTPDLTAFMTWLPGKDGESSGFGLTLGTGLKDLGKRLYFGASYSFGNRLLLSGGGFTQTVTTADGNAISISAPNLFASIKQVRKVGLFFSFSATPF